MNYVGGRSKGSSKLSNWTNDDVVTYFKGLRKGRKIK